MANRRIDSSGLASLVAEYLNAYGSEVKDALEEAQKTTAKEVVKELRAGGGYQTHATGAKYNKGWTSKTEASRLGSATVVYNSAVPGLAHLLEFGHAKRNGGRTRAFPHIAPAADSVEQKFEAAFEKQLNK